MIAYKKLVDRPGVGPFCDRAWTEPVAGLCADEHELGSNPTYSIRAPSGNGITIDAMRVMLRCEGIVWLAGSGAALVAGVLRKWHRRRVVDSRLRMHMPAAENAVSSYALLITPARMASG